MITHPANIDRKTDLLFTILLIFYWMIDYAISSSSTPQYYFHCHLCFIRGILFYVVALTLTLLSQQLIVKFRIYTKSMLYIIIFIITYSFICGLLWIFYKNFLLDLFIGKINYDTSYLRKYFWIYSFSSVYPFTAWISLFLGYKIYENITLEKQKAENAQLIMQSAQLEMLRYQLNPSFLFSTLSSLRSLIRIGENESAEKIVTKISEYLKYSLLEGENNNVPLLREIKIIQHYFDIEMIRLGENLEVEYNIDKDSENFQIPVLLLYPLVENTVKHGIKTSKSPLKVTITTKVYEDNLNIEIINTGKWIDEESDIGTQGTGISNTIKKLDITFPERHSFKIIKNYDSVIVRIKLEGHKRNL